MLYSTCIPTEKQFLERQSPEEDAAESFARHYEFGNANEEIYRATWRRTRAQAEQQQRTPLPPTPGVSKMGAEPSITSSETQQNGNIYVTGKSELIRLALGLDLGLALGLVLGLVLGLDLGLALGLDLGLVLGLDLGLALGLVLGLALGLDLG
jgi:hypothetical protein